MRDRPNAFTARLLRPADLLDVVVTAVGTGLTKQGLAVVVGKEGGLLVVELAFQHLGEQAYPESAVDPDPSGIARHRAARPTRLVYELPPGTKLPWTTSGLLKVLPTLRLRVVPLATPAGAGARRIPEGRPVPREPEPEETAIEVPYRLVVSPSAEHGAFVHEAAPLVAGEDTGRAQLWRTALTVRVEDATGQFLGHSTDPAERVVRAVWSPDMAPADIGDDADVTLMSTNPVDRRTLVRQSAATHEGITPVPIEVDHLHLSAVGAWVDWRGAWDTDLWSGSFAGWGTGTVTLVSSYRHVAQTGRDGYVRLAYPGFLFPFGHRADLVKVTERKVDAQTGTAYLRQRTFIVLRETVRSWTERDTPLRKVTLQPLVTPSIDPPDDVNVPFIPYRGGRPFGWELVSEDRAGDPVLLSAGLLFVPDAAIVVMRDRGHTPAQIGEELSSQYFPVSLVEARGQHVSFAVSTAHGDTRLEVATLRWDGHTDSGAFTSRPYLVGTQAVVPALRHLAGQAPGVDLAFAPAYLSPAADDAADPGFGPGNPSGLFLTLTGGPVLVDFSTGSDRAGGFLTPNLMVRALSRGLGAVGDDGTSPGGLADGRFDPSVFLQGALPKLFGLFDLVELIEAVTGQPLSLDAAPDFVTEALDAVTAILTEAGRLRDAATGAQARLAQDLAEAVAAGAHQGARDAIAAAQTELDAAVGRLLPRLTAVVDALGALAGNPGGVADAQDAVTDLIGSLGALHPVLDHPRLPAAVRSALRVPLEALDALLAAADVLEAIADFAEHLLTPADGVTARFEWRPEIGSWPAGSSTPVFRAKDASGLALAVVVRASARGAPAVDVSAELRSFALELLPDEPLMAMNFSRLGFRVGSATKPEVDVVFDGIEFRGVLGFIETLRRMIPFDGFADPPYVDVAPDGVTAGFDLELPSVAVGVFSLENIALGADARVPFLGDAVTVGFNFCSKDSPFRLTVMAIGGGGWVAVRLSPMGMVVLEMGLEAAAALSVDLGVASGSVSVSVGIYLRLEGDGGSLTGYFRIRGEVDVLGLISASITLELSLTYDLPTGKMIGRASIVVEVEVAFFSESVEITCERRLAGSQGDPVLADIMPPDDDGHSDAWSEYCAAFAPGA